MGQFSWYTQDDNLQIVNDEQRNVYMIDPRDGTLYKECCYKGYGIFGGRDYYELMADINKKFILKDRVVGIKNYTFDILYQISLGCRLKSAFPLLAHKTLDDAKEMMMDMDYRAHHNANPDGSWPKQDINKFDEFYKEQVLDDLKERIAEEQKYTTLYSKNWKDLTEEDIDEKRGDGISLWFSYIEPDQHSYCAPKLNPFFDKIICPILVSNPEKWKKYIDKHPDSDPNQGYSISDEEDEEEV